MRTIDEPLVKKLVQDFSQGFGDAFDGVTQRGCQREMLQNLGFGWVYFAMVRALELGRVLVIGSGRGFSVACFAMGIEANPDARVVFVDPGYDAWPVDGEGTDTAAGLWKDAASTAEYFSSHLGLKNVRHLMLRSDEAFVRLRAEGERFDLVYVDGEHSYRQSLSDFHSSWELLAPGGIIVAHDARCPQWPGVALAIAHFEAGHADAQTFILSQYPGLGLIQQRNPLLAIRHATAEENDRINQWREGGGVNRRPLDDPEDPRPGVDHGDSRTGLFSILEDGELIGGFGMKYRAFTGNGPDNFPPDGSRNLAGFLCYGVVIKPECRGRGRWKLAIMELLRWCGDDGFFLITANPMSDEGKPWRTRKAGETPAYSAYHITLRECPGGSTAQPNKHLVSGIGAASRPEDLWIENNTLRQEIERCRRECESARRELSAVLSSRLWKATAFLRRW